MTNIRKAAYRPGWTRSVPQANWKDEYGWINNGHLSIPASSVSALEIALCQVEDQWACIATAATPAGPSYFQFSVLGFIEFWQFGLQTEFQVKLYCDVTAPFLYRHPAIIPMELYFDRDTGEFSKSIVYAVSDFTEITQVA